MGKSITSFKDLQLSDAVLKVLEEVGYESPTPIQSEIIPHVLNGDDVLGQAQTGTGKTAAFALPLLTKIQVNKTTTQVLVLAPTRELAIQVSEAFQKYASKMTNFHVCPIYGGQSYPIQLKQLKRGVHVVVGTPGRVMDHIKRKTLSLDHLKTMVLDEADEMLRMGFIDDVEWILEQTPSDVQIALFSATMPPEIRKIAGKYLKNPTEVTIKVKTATADTIRQRYWIVKETNKLDALTRILETETYDGIIIFVRTKTETVELNERLLARGYASSAINGDIAQKQREKTVEDLKSGKLDILIATDVAARGLDVERISLVINYDIPYDTESYIHRIGRTGRAGRKGDAILFVSPREQRMLGVIQKVTNQKMDELVLPTREDIRDLKITQLKTTLEQESQSEDINIYSKLVEDILEESNMSSTELGSALLKLYLQKEPSLSVIAPRKKTEPKSSDENRGDEEQPESGMERFRVDMGKKHGIRPGHLVGIITGETGLEGSEIGKILIYENYSTIDLPEGMPARVFQVLKKVSLFNKPLKITKFKSGGDEPRSRERSKKKTRR